MNDMFMCKNKINNLLCYDNPQNFWPCTQDSSIETPSPTVYWGFPVSTLVCTWKHLPEFKVNYSCHRPRKNATFESFNSPCYDKFFWVHLLNLIPCEVAGCKTLLTLQQCSRPSLKQKQAYQKVTIFTFKSKGNIFYNVVVTPNLFCGLYKF